MKKILFYAFILTFLLALPLPFLNQAFGAQITIPNPLNYDSVEELIKAIIDFLWTLALVLVPLLVVIAGFLFITAGGDPQKVTNAKRMITYIIVGFLVIASAKGLITLIQTVINKK